ncbi:MAG: FAD-dependent oxidoreductase [Bacteriovoracaceae bacterium]|nr:FAD-dependent oxidoreductase [Bacteriovoracaceae bacterium]
MQEESGPLGSLGLSKEVNIIGAGISGLLMGHYLKNNGYSVKIFEKNSRTGGKIQTLTGSFGLAETAANAVFTNEDAIELMKELGLTPHKAPSKLKRLLYRGNKLRAFPFHIWEVLFLIFNLPKKHPPIDDKLTIYEFFAPLLGKRAAYDVLSAVFGGIYATDSKTLRFKSVFKDESHTRTYFGFIRELIKSRKQREHSPSSISFKLGMQELIDALTNELKNELVFEAKTEIDESKNTIICTDAIHAAEILKQKHPAIGRELSKISYQAVNSATLIMNRPVNELEGAFGALFPPSSKITSAGILSNSSIFPARAKNQDHRSYTFIGLGQNYSKENALEDLKALDPKIDWNSALVEEFVTKWNRGIPLYTYDRYLSIKKIRTLIHNERTGLVIFGNYVDGISIREMISMAKSFALKGPKVISS